MRARDAGIGACSAIAVLALVSACRPASPPPPTDAPGSVATAPTSTAASSQPELDASSDAAIRALAAGDAAVLDAGAEPAGDPMANHVESREALLALFSIKPLTEDEKKRILPDNFLRGAFNVDGPGHINQGNKAIARHTISKEKCLAGLKGITLQTQEQHDLCGADNMVPIHIKGKAPWFCIDIFEFPNKPCELPVVWAPPTWDKKVCELQGKRLCSDIEWNIACRGDPNDGPDQRYAYGDKLDIEICNTNKGHTKAGCTVHDAKTTWDTCATETEPSGSFPKCKSRFGVYDQHGNVAEVMMRREGDKVFTQLKGSAWFYNELAKEPNEPIPASTPNKQGAYPDHCNFDPRWHVEPIEQGFHVNYHLGFRCCKSIP
jgi:hypothetical protein